MLEKKIKVSSPGKLMFLGEWAVLEDKKCIVMSVDKRIKCEIEESDFFEINLLDFNKKTKFKIEDEIFFNSDDDVFKFVKSAITEFNKKIKIEKPFRITTYGSSDIMINNKKIGFGTSAASIVSIVGALFEFHGMSISENMDEIFRISIKSHDDAQGKKGSGFDIAASLHGGIIEYCKKDFSVRKLSIPKEIEFAVAWSGESSSTSDMMDLVNSYKEKNTDEYNNFMNEISECVENCIDAIELKNNDSIIECVKKNRKILSDFTERSKILIETEKLKLLSDISESNKSAAKLSGAGGGDCGIIVSLGNLEEIKTELGKNNIDLIDVNLFVEGLRRE